MDITTKYNINDEVFVINNSQVLKCKVSAIAIAQGNTEEKEAGQLRNLVTTGKLLPTTPIIKYSLKHKMYTLEREERHTFLTKEELIASLT